MPSARLQAAPVGPAADAGLPAEGAARTAEAATGRTAAAAESVAAASVLSRPEGTIAVAEAGAAAGLSECAAEPVCAAAESPLASAAAAPGSAAGAGFSTCVSGLGHRDCDGATSHGASPCGDWPLLLCARASGGAAIAHAGQLYGCSGAAARALFAAAPAAVAAAAAAAAARAPAHLAPLLGLPPPAPCRVGPRRHHVCTCTQIATAKANLKGQTVNAGPRQCELNVQGQDLITMQRRMLCLGCTRHASVEAPKQRALHARRRTPGAADAARARPPRPGAGGPRLRGRLPNRAAPAAAPRPGPGAPVERVGAAAARAGRGQPARPRHALGADRGHGRALRGADAGTPVRARAGRCGRRWGRRWRGCGARGACAAMPAEGMPQGRVGFTLCAAWVTVLGTVVVAGLHCRPCTAKCV